MSIIDRWKERRAEKKERQRHGAMKLITDKDPGTDDNESAMRIGSVSLFEILSDMLWQRQYDHDKNRDLLVSLSKTFIRVAKDECYPDIVEVLDNFIDVFIASDDFTIDELRSIMDRIRHGGRNGLTPGCERMMQLIKTDPVMSICIHA